MSETLKSEQYAWVITQDNIDSNLVGRCGPKTCSDELSAKNGEAIKKHPKAQKFRMLDGDNEVYCYGYFVDLSPEGSEGPTGFEPLDDCGMPGLGAVTIQYQNNETAEYETL